MEVGGCEAKDNGICSPRRIVWGSFGRSPPPGENDKTAEEKQHDEEYDDHEACVRGGCS